MLKAHQGRPGRNLMAITGGLRSSRADSNLHARIATTREHLAGAYELVYERYLARGYIDPHPGGIVYHEALALPSSRTLIAVDGSDRVVGTLSIVGDNARGLQAEATYPDEIASLRAEGRRMAQVCLLAIRKQSRLMASNVFFALSKLMIHYAYWQDYTDLVLAIHPRHFRFYYRYFRTYPIGPQRPHALARGNPSVCYRIDLRHLPRNASARLWRQYFSDPVPEQELSRLPPSSVDHLHFRRRCNGAAGTWSSGRADYLAFADGPDSGARRQPPK